jgi:hypothetical protein
VVALTWELSHCGQDFSWWLEGREMYGGENTEVCGVQAGSRIWLPVMRLLQTLDEPESCLVTVLGGKVYSVAYSWSCTGRMEEHLANHRSPFRDTRLEIGPILCKPQREEAGFKPVSSVMPAAL